MRSLLFFSLLSFGPHFCRYRAFFWHSLCASRFILIALNRVGGGVGNSGTASSGDGGGCGGSGPCGPGRVCQEDAIEELSGGKGTFGARDIPSFLSLSE